MKSFLKQLSLAAILTSQADAKVIPQKYKVEKLAAPAETSYEIEGSRMIVQGKKEDHTRYASGKFKHPFLTAPKGVKHIEYPDSSSFSIKLEARSVQKKRKGHSGIRAQAPRQKSYAELIYNYFRGVGSNNFSDIVWTNYGDLEYIGTIVMGTSLQEMRVLWDTGSDVFLLIVDYTADWALDSYDTTASTAFTKTGGAPFT